MGSDTVALWDVIQRGSLSPVPPALQLGTYGEGFVRAPRHLSPLHADTSERAEGAPHLRPPARVQESL